MDIKNNNKKEKCTHPKVILKSERAQLNTVASHSDPVNNLSIKHFLQKLKETIKNKF